MKPVLEIKHVSKKYRIRHENTPYRNLREAIPSLFKKGASLEEFWALNDISFDVMQGESIGIIGKNGAGKSTLLKILSRITPPTMGSISCRGRIASLLEVGTGFHPELTGKENIYLNGSILGMRKSEIKQKFDEIVDFSGVEKFIDTPIKHFSSGMQLRLAFSVAAFLEPEILIIDEVLAVGDHEFQKKCITKMQSVSRQGRTIIFVSHNIGVIGTLCHRGIMLKQGRIHAMGDIGTVIHEYHQLPPGNEYHEGLRVNINYEDLSGLWIKDSAINISITWPTSRFSTYCYADIAFYTFDGTKIFSLQSHRMLGHSEIKPGANSINFRIINPGLVEKDYRIDVGLKSQPDGHYEALVENALTITPGGKNLAHYKASDTIIVPEATCRYY